jgi:hypothetical protein
MNEWLMVGIVITGTVVLLGGGGWIASVLRSDKKSE